MSEQVLSSENQAPETADSEPRIGAEFVEFLQEIQATPRESWPQLIQIMRLFREAVTKDHKVSDIRCYRTAQSFERITQKMGRRGR